MFGEILLQTAIALLFFWGSHRTTSKSVDSYQSLQLVLVGVVGVVVCAFVLGVMLSFSPAFLGVLGISMISGSITGSWPDTTRRWPSLLRRDLASAPGTLLECIGGVGGFLVGLWAWSALAEFLGIFGVILGACALIICCIGGAIVPFFVKDIVNSHRNQSSPRRGV